MGLLPAIKKMISPHCHFDGERTKKYRARKGKITAPYRSTKFYVRTFTNSLMILAFLHRGFHLRSCISQWKNPTRK